MTFLTIRNSIGFKLFNMHILMAAGAVDRYSGKFLVSVACLLLVEMTIAAGLPGMRPFQFKLGLFVIKIDPVPAVLVVAGFTGSIRIILLAYIRLMYIAVTILALLSNFPERPFLLFLMAGNARGGNMRTL